MADYPEKIPLLQPGVFAVSLDKIAREGRTDSGAKQGEIKFDVQGNDPVAKEFRTLRDGLIAKIAEDREILRASREPDGKGQVAYEKRLSELVERAAEGSKKFSSTQYRHKGTDKKVTNEGRNLNQLDSTVEFDCEAMSYIKGLLIRASDQAAVAAEIRPAPTHFYYTVGNVSSNPSDILGGHAYLISSVTGNIVEATNGHENYSSTTLGFEEHIAGFPTATNDGVVYNSTHLEVNEPLAAKRLALILKGELEGPSFSAHWDNLVQGNSPRHRNLVDHAAVSSDGSILQTESGAIVVSQYPNTDRFSKYQRSEEVERGIGEGEFKIPAAAGVATNNERIVATALAYDTQNIAAVIAGVYAVYEQEKKDATPTTPPPPAAPIVDAYASMAAALEAVKLGAGLSWAAASSVVQKTQEPAADIGQIAAPPARDASATGADIQARR